MDRSLIKIEVTSAEYHHILVLRVERERISFDLVGRYEEVDSSSVESVEEDGEDGK